MRVMKHLQFVTFSPPSYVTAFDRELGIVFIPFLKVYIALTAPERTD